MSPGIFSWNEVVLLRTFFLVDQTNFLIRSSSSRHQGLPRPSLYLSYITLNLIQSTMKSHHMTERVLRESNILVVKVNCKNFYTCQGSIFLGIQSKVCGQIRTKSTYRLLKQKFAL